MRDFCLPILAVALALPACSSGPIHWHGNETNEGGSDTTDPGGNGGAQPYPAGGDGGSGDGPTHHPGGGSGGTGATTGGPGGQGGSGAQGGAGGQGGSGAQGGAGGQGGSGAQGGVGGQGGAGGVGGGNGPTGAGGGSPQCAGTIPQVPGCYWEPVCPDASLADLANSFSSGNWLSASLEAMNRRYPSASCLFNLYQNDVGNFADTSGFGPLCESMMTMMHEETHGYDYEHALGNDHFAYFVRCDFDPQVPWIDSFPRSEIAPLVQGSATNLYDGTYLVGEQGTYGWIEVLDEWNAYLNGMAAIGIVGDYVPSFGISGTDGALAFAYYAELYLRVARTQHPSVYGAITGDQKFKDFLKLQWNRMHFFLKIAEKYPKLSIEADNIKQLVYAPENQSELEKVIGPLKANECN
jgi:hypothetical protein